MVIDDLEGSCSSGVESGVVITNKVHNIMRSLPADGRSSFTEQFQHFRSLNSANVRPPARFLFLAKYVKKLERNYRSNPSLFDLNPSLTNVGVKAVRYAASNPKPKLPNPNFHAILRQESCSS